MMWQKRKVGISEPSAQFSKLEAFQRNQEIRKMEIQLSQKDLLFTKDSIIHQIIVGIF